jgi:RNA polymerase sigma factor (sigma-70 family)
VTTLTTTSAAAGRGLDAAQLYERYGEQLFRYCVGRLRDREEAADAVQNTFLRVHVALEKGVVPQFESAWLYKIAHNVCLSRIDAAGRRSRVETPRDLDDHDLEAALAVPADEHEALAGLSEALAELPHNLRQAILLREWQGLSYAEIAEAMGTTVPAVETLLYRARKQLAAALEAGGRRVRAALGGLLDLLGVRGLLARGSGAVSGASAAKVAVGTALLVAGGSGAAAAIAVTAHAPHATPRQTSRRTVPTGLAAGARTAAAPPAFSHRGAAPAALAAAASAPAVTAAATARSAPAPPSVAPTAAPLAATATATALRTSPARPSTSGAAAAAPAAGATAPSPATPAPLETPTASAPTLTAPTVTAPTVTAPTVTTPTVTTPALTAPVATVSATTVSATTLPATTLPAATLPAVPPPLPVQTPTVPTPAAAVTAPSLP